MTKHIPTKSTLVILTLSLTIWACKTVYPTEPIQESLLSDQILLGYPSYNTQSYVIIDHEKPLFKKQYVASYLYKQGIPRWVGWHLQTSDLGDIDRQDDFRLDESLPSDAIKIKPTDYTGSGFDRGHVCPSGDRTASEVDNSAAFLMTNMIPQAPSLNRGLWSDLEEYCRTRVKLGYEAYIYAGGYGTGGKGSNGEAASISSGKVTVPKRCWKVILIMPEGINDVIRLNSGVKPEIIAIDVPNSQDVSGTRWRNYELKVRELEGRTGLNFFTELDQAVQDKIEN